MTEHHNAPVSCEGATPALGEAAAHVLVVTHTTDGVCENRSGRTLVEALEELGCDVTLTIVPPDVDSVRAALAQAIASADVVVTSGGTGVRPGDVVVDETLALGVVELPGIAEEIRRRGTARTPVSMLSRAVCGIVRDGERRVVVLNSPSSRRGAADATSVLGEVLHHLLRDLRGVSRSG